jgi:hypothetical protein
MLPIDLKTRFLLRAVSPFGRPTVFAPATMK